MTRGRPINWSDNELIEKLLEIKSKYPDIKLTKSMLEKETGIGRNTWGRRMESNIKKLNVQNIPKKSNPINNNTLFPSIEMSLKHSKNNPIKLMDELLKLESIILEQNNKLEETKNYKKKFEQILKENSELKKENEVLNLKYKFYESAYLSIIVSSSFTFLQDVDGSIIREHGIKESLINMNKDIDRNLSLSKMNVIFDSIERDLIKNDRKNKTLDILKNDYDI